VDIKPADPVEGILISQLVVANEAALKLYQLAWLNSGHFEASAKYLQLADRASRTVAVLSERLDHHRNWGQQKIVVEHTTTVNANQAVVTDSVVTGKNSEAAPSAKVLATVTDQLMEIREAEKQKETVPVVGEGRRLNDHQPHAKGSRRAPMHSKIKADGKVLSCACGARLAGLP
jgi:hypothetical protein